MKNKKNAYLCDLLHFLAVLLTLMERVSGIEPPYSPWQGDVLPLNYTRINGGSDEDRTRDLLRDREAC